MKKMLLAVSAAGALALIPAAAGFAGNTALSRQINMKTTPTSPTDDQGVGRSAEPGDDKGGLRPDPRASGPGDEKGGLGPSPSASEAKDDTGGLRPQSERTEPGDDRDASGRVNDDRGRGSDDSGSDDRGGDHHGGTEHD